MAYHRMGNHYYEKTVLEDGIVKLHRLSKEELPWTPKKRPDTPNDVVRIDYYCRGCKAIFHQNIPPIKGDSNMGEVAGHFTYCDGGVDYRFIKRNEIDD